jgi:PAS domain S-box-containing protein
MIGKRGLLRSILEFSGFVCGALMLTATGLGNDSPDLEKSVLVLYGERGDLPAIQAIEENMREVFHGSTVPHIELFPEYLDFTRFPAERFERCLVSYLQERYAGRRIDLVIPVASSALRFVLAHREGILAGAPLVFCGVDTRDLAEVRLPVDATGVRGHLDFERTIGLILQLQPDVPEIVCVGGSSSFDRRWVDETRKIFERRYPKVRVRWIEGRSLAETLDEVSRVPRESAVLLIAMSRDGAGRSTSSLDVARDLERVSKAPIYGVSSNFLKAGVVGGSLIDFGANGRSAALLALKALRGQWVPYEAAETEIRNPLAVNWLALKKAGLPEWRVPKDALVLYRPPGLWETHRSFILIGAGAILFQTALIGVLVVERLWRRRAEASLRQSEERMSLILEASPNAVVLANEEDQVVLVNARAENIFGYRRNDLVGQKIEILVPERFRTSYQAYRAQFLGAPIARARGSGRELFVRRKDGSEFPVEIGISPIRSNEGNLVLAVITDISARKQAEAEARRYHEELLHFSRVEILGAMVTSLAHELNQPLTGIMNNASAGRRFIARGLAEISKLDELFKVVVTDARRAGEIIRGIRGMVRKGEALRSPVNLNDVIASVTSFVHSDALGRRCALVTEPDPELPLVEANQVQLQQVLLNLIVNAFEAMREIPAVERRVIIRSQCEPDGRVRVSVRDFGTGLPAEEPQRIFEQFFSTKREGMGMGLAIARSIITSHGGEMAAANSQGGGACVNFSLPIITGVVADE